MPARFTITVSNQVARVLRHLAEVRGDKPTSVASYELTKRIDDEMRQGVYIDPGTEAVDRAAEILGVDKDALSEFVRAQSKQNKEDE